MSFNNTFTYLANHSRQTMLINLHKEELAVTAIAAIVVAINIYSFLLYRKEHKK